MQGYISSLAADGSGGSIISELSGTYRFEGSKVRTPFDQLTSGARVSFEDASQFYGGKKYARQVQLLES